MKRKIFKICIILAMLLLAIYMFISAVYIYNHIDHSKSTIDYNKSPDIVGMGFSPKDNKIRVFMGLPETYNTDKGVGSEFLSAVIIRTILGTIISLLLVISIIKQFRKKELNDLKTD